MIKLVYNSKEYRLLSSGKLVELDKNGKAMMDKEITFKDMIKRDEDETR